MALNPYTEIAVGTQHFQLLERFTVILYDKTSALEHVDETRKELFCQKGKTMEALPPTQDALLQHYDIHGYPPREEPQLRPPHLQTAQQSGTLA
ncbi:hypothetical protein Pcinc_015054 [Petrolisthes cinctipes]|uniref:Uncharacterized protein n=1 Tax=Petrolisthes cinctipes TaxID=88211 RepID=A0AAE1FTW5_PETCI|nr:hypothetical protein Pcinc_015054 [Petrolisthes cinctipes]